MNQTNKSIVVITILSTLAGGLSVSAAEPPLPAKVEFNRDIRPFLSDTCFHCHGPDAHARKAGLRLDIREEALRPAESGEKPIVPGKPDLSEAARRVLTNDKDDLMPPPKANKPLTARQKELFKRWIEQGAEYQVHWSYVPPVKDKNIPAGAHAVDALVQRRLAEIGFTPSAEADRRTLIRRLYADLIGLPPKPEEVAAFVNDPSPKAYEQLVERVLANPHYGERMAIGWLDVVRFADTIGYHSDNPRNVWPYRDWVIQAFNSNLRFDRFTLEQIAGDLLPDATAQTRVGSAFNRLLLSTEEGGAQPKDYESRMLTDRVRAVGAAWMGQTTGCCQCHDHKFDPLTMRDFYSLGAFFADIKEPVIGRREDGLMVATPAQEQQLAKLDAAVADAKKKLNAVLPKLDAAQKEWEASVAGHEAALPELREAGDVPDAEVQRAKKAAAALKKDVKARNKKESDAVRDYFLNRVTNLFVTERQTIAKVEKERAALYDSLPKCLVSESMPQRRAVRILPRGNWMDDSGEVMKAALPTFLAKPNADARELNRLDLAQWLVARDNPLTARAVMNRMWAQFFGIGLSRVLSDLGAQGEPPVNGPLLDWLACEFMDSGWDVKHMVRTIVTSRTYQQVSTADAKRLAADPENRELARQSRFRLDAELVRDNALAVSGLLVPKIGGPSVKPYQPERYWENLAFPPREYQNDSGASQYRRGLYTWWQRTFLHPSLLAFDAPSREECAAERNRSNIPQQALVLLNDPSYVEAARSFAARILTECQGPPAQRITWAWQQALQRDPRADEMKTMAALLDKQLAAYRADAASAGEVLNTGLTPAPPNLDKSELAAWTHLARVLLNLHESITRS